MTILWPENILVGDVLYPPGGTLGPRIQPSLELVLLHAGEMTVWIDDEKRFAPAGSAAVLFPGHEERFAFAADAETHHTYAHLWLGPLPDDLAQRLHQLPWPLPLSTAMTAMMRDALALRQSTLTTTEAMLRALGMAMLWRYLGEGERLLAGDLGTHPALQRAQYFVQSHLHETMALEDIAEAAAVSPSHLIRLFRDELQTTPMAWLWEQRVRRGIELLESTGLPVGHIAQQCGFQTSHHFSRRVRALTGLSPSAVRQRAWGR